MTTFDDRNNTGSSDDDAPDDEPSVADDAGTDDTTAEPVSDEDARIDLTLDDVWARPSSSSADGMFASIQTNHVRLTALADQKASILVGAATVSLGFIAPVDDPPVSLVILALTAALAGAAGILSLLPRNSRVAGGRRNLLYFGTHSKLDPESFHKEMAEMLQTQGGVHRAITEDLRQMGLVLTRKFRYINVAYGILLTGLLLTAITYALGV